MRRMFIVGLIGCAAVAGCATPVPEDRHARLLSMAVDEAGRVPQASDRLRRQLNLAERQVRMHERSYARGTLAAAGTTLRTAGPGDFTSQVRIAGWVSISELSRRAGQPDLAGSACEQAVAALRDVNAPTERAAFVVGVANELRQQRGKAAGAALLAEAGDWVGQLPVRDVRRAALTEVADAMFDCEDFAGGQTLLRIDPDPAWRSDTLAMLAALSPDARDADWSLTVGNGVVPGSVMGGASGGRSLRPTTGPARFQRAVDYRSVFGDAAVDR